MSKKVKKKLKLIKPDSQDNTVATIDKPNLPKISWDEEEKFMDILVESSGDWIKDMGVVDEDAAKMLLAQLANPVLHGQQANKEFINGTIAMYLGMEPQDNIEAMLMSQMVVGHNMAMEMSKRAMLPEQTVDGVNANINRVTKLMRTFVAQVEALKKKRTGGKQTILVQHVNVNEGGQAVVANVQGGGVDG